MLKAFVALVLLATIVGVHAQPAEPTCATLETTITVLESNKWDHVVVRGEKAKEIIDAYNSLPGKRIDDPAVDTVIFAMHEPSDRAIVFFTDGKSVCHALHIPTSLARKFVAKA